MKHEGRCSCGAIKIGITANPVMKYNCHCSHCRAFASKYKDKPVPYHGAVAVWRWTVALNDNDDLLEYEETTGVGGLFGLSRGRCSECKDTIWERGTRLVSCFAMVSAEPLQIEPDENLYYNSGLQNGPHGLRTTIYTDLGSLAYELYVIFTFGLLGLPASLLGFFGNSKTFKKD